MSCRLRCHVGARLARPLRHARTNRPLGRLLARRLAFASRAAERVFEQNESRSRVRRAPDRKTCAWRKPHMGVLPQSRALARVGIDLGIDRFRAHQRDYHSAEANCAYHHIRTVVIVSDREEQGATPCAYCAIKASHKIISVRVGLFSKALRRPVPLPRVSIFSRRDRRERSPTCRRTAARTAGATSSAAAR